MLDAVIIAVGTEMLTSQRIDTNSLFLAEQLNGLGIEVRMKAVVGDDRALLTLTIQRALEDASLVILTGGLGPTEDDLTREAAADAIGRPLVYHDEIAKLLEARFRARGRKMSENNKRQAYVVESAQALPNTSGTAPGQWIEAGGRVILLLPGPPSEMKPLFLAECLPRLTARVPNVVIHARHYRVTGMTESDLDALISPVYKSYSNPITTVLASTGDIQIYLRARSPKPAEADRLLAEVGDPIEKLLGDRLYSRNGQSLEEVIGELLRPHAATVATAESVTGGMVGERLTSVAGSSDYFLGGFLAYSNDLKCRLLGVPAELIATHTSVSAEVAQAMAQGALERTGATYAVSTTGEAGPHSSTGAPLGTVYIGVAGGREAPSAQRFLMPGDRHRVRGFITNAALDSLRRRIMTTV